MPKRPATQNQSATDTETSDEKPRAFLLGVVTATLVDEIHAEIQRIESGKAGGQPQTDMIELPHNNPSPKGAGHD